MQRFIAITLLAWSVIRWGPEGHRIVAQVAADRLSPAAAAEVRRLLGGQTLADVSSWADDVRRSRPETGPWHYVDIEVTDSSYVPSRDCPGGACIIDAIAHETAVLADRKRSDADRAEALKFVVHFVGDLHQPLHASDRHDKGGNDVKVTFDGRPTNLHSVWDSGILGDMGSEDEIVADIEREIGTRTDLAKIVSGTPITWAMESHDITRDMVYRMLPQSLVIDRQYVDAARPIVRERLLRGGVRLAAVLNYALGQ